MADYRKLQGEPESVQDRAKNDPLRTEAMKTPDEGLSSAEAKKRLQRDG